MKILNILLTVFLLTFRFPASASQPPENGWVQHKAISADGTSIAYYVKGGAKAANSAAPLLVISGGPGSDHRYMRVGGSFDELSKSRQVVMFDQRGTSNSGAATGTPRLAQWAEDVEAIRSDLEVFQLNLLGHSFGGIVAMAYADAYRDHVKSIIFANSTATSIKETSSILADVFPDRIEQWQQTRRALTPRFKARDIAVFTAMEFVSSSKGDAFMEAIKDYDYNIEVNNALRLDMAELDYSTSASGYEFPTLVVHGRYDPVIAPSTAWQLHQLIPDSEIAILHATGHLPFAESPAAFVERVQRFLAAQE